ncbi:uncharacterized protein M6B38_392445 [Iris pallida]|uniref:Photosystem II reaction center PsbP family protein n=1 Tax=Iris pallida TaxID=29817 RepID=A0AAX6FZE6_IRIPA|nr:uncharacterized protein M6B38_392445 [Iris pallida]
MAVPVHHLLPSCSLNPPHRNPNPRIPSSFSRREAIIQTGAISISSVTLTLTLANSPSLASTEVAPPPPPPRKQALDGICSTKSWFRFFGDGFAIRVPPSFEDIMEPEDYNAGLSLYGDKVKPKAYAARFATPDGSAVLSVVVRPTNQLKITFLEAKDITDLGSLKAAAKIFVPAGANLYSARTFKIKDDENVRTYYFYEFGGDGQRVALVAAVNSGKAYIAGATAPQSKWEEDGVQLRSAAISLTIL